MRSQMILAVHPTTDRSWMLGMHHCETDHVFTVAEQELFEWIGRRLADSLSTLIVLRELRASEATLERRIRDRTAELERANEELESFSYSVSHDLKAPLRAVTGYTAALLDDCGEAVGTTGREYIRRMQASCEQMDTLIRSLLELSHVSRAEMTAVQSVDLSRHAEQAIAALRVLHPNREARVEIEPELVVEGDSALLRAAVANLIGNAWKYSAQKPVAEIRMRRLSAADEPMTLVIEDNGAGFDNRKAERIFQAFERLHPTSQFVGSGIGLATVRRVLDKHGATISADGQVGRGATFTIRFTA